MSWLRNAVSKAVEVGNKKNLTRAVINYADSVVHQAGQAVAEGAKLLQERIAARNYKSYKDAVRRLEEAAVSCRGPERVQLLRRWLILLKEIEKVSQGSAEDKPETLEQHLASDDNKENNRKASLVLYYDPDEQSEPMTFLHVFLHSQALEGIVLSMILAAPDDEEVALLLQMFEICLTGAKEVHLAIVSSIQDLAKVFSDYEDEVLVKREELLQFAQGAISGLKLNADLVRIDTEAANLWKKLDEIKSSSSPVVSSESFEKPSKEQTAAAIEVLKESLAHIRICSRLEGLLLKKQQLQNGDSPEIHAQKVDKLKVLSDSLANASSKSEKRITDTRFQKEEALKFRVTKESEVGEMEKEIEAEIVDLEKQRDQLEAELKRVNISLVAAQKRLQNTKEEKDQFDEANRQIVQHLNTKEDELLRSIDSCKVEGSVLKTWVNFLDDTWTLQVSYTETKEKHAKDELENHEAYFVNLAINLLSGYKKELGPSITRIRIFVENLKSLSKEAETTSKGDSEDPKLSIPKKNLEEEYLDFEAKIITTFNVVDNMREQLYAQQGEVSRKDDSKVKELFDDIEKLRLEFESIERPILDIESPPSLIAEAAPSQNQGEVHETTKEAAEVPKSGKDDHAEAPKSRKDDRSEVQKSEKKGLGEASGDKKERALDPEELAKLESEFGKVSKHYTEDEIGGWDFDEFEKELTSSST